MHDLKNAPVQIAERGCVLGFPIQIQRETQSTNDAAKNGARGGDPHGATWVADTQTEGRGRQGRMWFSPRGENLLFSVLLRTKCPLRNVPPIALVAGLAVRDVVARIVGDAKVKWPNDVIVNGKKIAGILVESSIVGKKVESVVIGIGLNVHTRSFPPELSEIATSLALEGGARSHDLDRATILADVLVALDHDVEHVMQHGLGLVQARLMACDALSGRRVSIDGHTGVASGIDPEGRLLLRDDAGVLHHISSGEAVLEG